MESMKNKFKCVCMPNTFACKHSRRVIKKTGLSIFCCESQRWSNTWKPCVVVEANEWPLALPLIWVVLGVVSRILTRSINATHLKKLDIFKAAASTSLLTLKGILLLNKSKTLTMVVKTFPSMFCPDQCPDPQGCPQIVTCYLLHTRCWGFQNTYMSVRWFGAL